MAWSIPQDLPCQERLVPRVGCFVLFHVQLTAFNDLFRLSPLQQWKSTTPAAEAERLVKGVNVLVVTPGRLLDHLQVLP